MDWRTLVAAIIATGATQTQIAEECGCAQSTISDLLTGQTAEPRWSLGQSLVAMAHRRGAKR